MSACSLALARGCEPFRPPHKLSPLHSASRVGGPLVIEGGRRCILSCHPPPSTPCPGLPSALPGRACRASAGWPTRLGCMRALRLQPGAPAAASLLESRPETCDLDVRFRTQIIRDSNASATRIRTPVCLSRHASCAAAPSLSPAPRPFRWPSESDDSVRVGQFQGPRPETRTSSLRSQPEGPGPGCTGMSWG